MERASAAPERVIDGPIGADPPSSQGVLVLDGPMGTELERRGSSLALPLWSAQAVFTDAALVEAIHLDYLRAGADVITTNTFRTNPRAFLAAGLSPARAAEATAAAVRLARDAVARYAAEGPALRPPPLLAGSVSTVEDCYRPDLVPDFGTLLQEHTAHADVLAAAGVDVLLVETMNTVREAEAAVTAAHATGLPVWVSFVGRPSDHEGARIYSGEPFAAGVEAIVRAGASRVGVNCMFADDVAPALRELRRHTDLPLLAYANGGLFDANGHWGADETLTPPRYAGRVAEWISLGATVVGGCCGTNPTHIGAIRGVVDTCRGGG